MVERRLQRTSGRAPRLGLWLVLGALALVSQATGARADVLVPAFPDLHAPSDEDVAVAQQAYIDLKRHYGDGDFERALAAANRAYQAAPNASTALLRATVLERLGQHRAAFEALLLAADLRPLDEERERIQAGLAKHGQAADPQLGWVWVRAAPPNASIAIGDVTVPQTRTVGVSVGTHALTLSAPDYETAKLAIVVEAGKRRDVDLALSRVEEPVPLDTDGLPGPAPVVQVTPADDETSTPVLPWVLVGSGALLLGGGAGLHVWSFATGEEANKYANPSAADEEAWNKTYKSKWNDADNQLYAAIACYATGGVALVTGVVLFFVGDDDEKEAGRPPAPIVAPAAMRGGAGLFMSGRF